MERNEILEKVVLLARKLCEAVKSDYTEGAFGPMPERLELEAALVELDKIARPDPNTEIRIDVKLERYCNECKGENKWISMPGVNAQFWGCQKCWHIKLRDAIHLVGDQ